MGTEDESTLTLQGRATAAAGAALVAACIVNPLDVIKTRIQAQAMAEASGQRSSCSTPWTCTSTLYEHAPHSSLHQHAQHSLWEGQQQHACSRAAARAWLPQRHTHTLSPEAAGSLWLRSSSSAGSKLAAVGSSNASTRAAAAAAAAAISAARSAAADTAAAAAAAALRRWGITEGPLPIRRTPPFPVPRGWTPAPVTAAVSSAATAGVLPAAAAAALAGAGAAGSCPACVPGQQAAAAAAGALPSNSMWEMARSIQAREGLPVLWRGTSASLLIAVPMVGIYMPLYDSLLDSWSQRLGSLAPVVSGTAARTVACFCVAPFELIRTRLQASAAAGVSMRSTLSSLVTEHQQHASQPPAAQQQLQQRTAQQLGATAAAAGQAQAQGQLQLQQAQAQQIKPATVLRAVPRMWTGFSATLVRDVPFSALYWALVEPLRQAMLPVNSHWPPLQRLDDFVHKRPHHHQQQQQKQQRPGSTGSGSGSGDASSALLPPSQQRLMHHSQLEILIANMVSGFVAGGLAAGATTPFDVVKTRMQIATPSQQQQQGALGSSSSSSGRGGGRGIRVFNILRDVYAREGVEGMFSGLKPRAARAAPACAIVISVYELLKSYLTLA